MASHTKGEEMTADRVTAERPESLLLCFGGSPSAFCGVSLLEGIIQVCCKTVTLQGVVVDWLKISNKQHAGAIWSLVGTTVQMQRSPCWITLVPV